MAAQYHAVLMSLLIRTASEECKRDQGPVYCLKSIEQRYQGEDAEDKVEDPGMSDRICV